MVSASGFHKNKEVSKSAFLFLDQGTTEVRILPAYSDKGVWFREIKEIPWYNDEGKYRPLVSPATVGKPCPFVNEGTRLYQLGGEENIKKAQDLRPRTSFIFNVIVKSTPDGDYPVDECVKVLKCPVTVYRGILDLDQDAAGGWGDITDLEKGINIRITKTGSGKTDTRYVVKPAGGGRSNILEWLEQKGYKQELTPKDLDAFFTPLAYEELEVLLKETLAKNSANVFEGIGDDGSKAPLAPVSSGNTEVAPPLPNRE